MKNAYLTAVMFLIALPSRAWASDVEKARDLARAGQLDLAISSLQEHIKRSPKDVEGYLLLGDLHAHYIAQSSSARDAQTAFNIRAAAKPHEAFAAAAYESARRVGASACDSVFYTGLMALHAGEPGRAAKVFEGILSSEPKCERARNYLPWTLQQAGAPAEKIIEALERAKIQIGNGAAWRSVSSGTPLLSRVVLLHAAVPKALTEGATAGSQHPAGEVIEGAKFRDNRYIISDHDNPTTTTQEVWLVEELHEHVGLDQPYKRTRGRDGGEATFFLNVPVKENPIIRAPNGDAELETYCTYARVLECWRDNNTPFLCAEKALAALYGKQMAPLENAVFTSAKPSGKEKKLLFRCEKRDSMTGAPQLNRMDVVLRALTIEDAQAVERYFEPDDILPVYTAVAPSSLDAAFKTIDTGVLAHLLRGEVTTDLDVFRASLAVYPRGAFAEPSLTKARSLEFVVNAGAFALRFRDGRLRAIEKRDGDTSAKQASAQD